MSQVIIFKNNEGGVSVIHPSPEVLQYYTIIEVAIKDVPFGTPFKIIDSSTLPDRVLRNQWDVDEVELTDGIGGESSEFN